MKVISDVEDRVDKGLIDVELSTVDVLVTPGESVREAPVDCGGLDMVEPVAFVVEDRVVVPDPPEPVGSALTEDAGKELEVRAVVGDTVDDSNKVDKKVELFDGDAKVGVKTPELLDGNMEDMPGEEAPVVGRTEMPDELDNIVGDKVPDGDNENDELLVAPVTETDGGTVS